MRKHIVCEVRVVLHCHRAPCCTTVLHRAWQARSATLFACGGAPRTVPHRTRFDSRQGAHRRSSHESVESQRVGSGHECESSQVTKIRGGAAAAQQSKIRSDLGVSDEECTTTPRKRLRAHHDSVAEAAFHVVLAVTFMDRVVAHWSTLGPRESRSCVTICLAAGGHRGRDREGQEPLAAGAD